MKPNLTHFSLIQLFNMLDGFDYDTQIEIVDATSGEAYHFNNIYGIHYQMAVRDVLNVLLTDATTLSTGRVRIRKLRVVLK